MKKGQSVTSFYVESLLLVVVFVCILLALTSVFGLGRRESVKAGFLTNAVTLAQNAADGFFLEEAEDSGEKETRYAADMTPDPAGEFLVRVEWRKDGDMIRGEVTVFRGEDTLYTLPLARYTGEEGA